MDEAIKLLLTYGPGGVIAVLLILGILIPKSFYDREVKRGDNATDAASKNADALVKVTDALKSNSSIVVELKAEISGLKAEVAALKSELIRKGVNLV